MNERVVAGFRPVGPCRPAAFLCPVFNLGRSFASERSRVRVRCRVDFFVRCICLRLAQSGHHDRAEPSPLLGVKRTSVRSVSMSAS